MFGEKKKKEEPRFVETKVPNEGGYITRILVDTEGLCGLSLLGVRALLDEDGKPLINEAYRRKKEKE